MVDEATHTEFAVALTCGTAASPMTLCRNH